MAENKEPKLGDLIEISRSLYQHWALYVGDGNVIHLGTASELRRPTPGPAVRSVIHDSARVMKEKLQKVVGKDKYQINNLLDEQHEPRPIQDILRDAESLVGKTLPYDVATRNCEHFITLLRYGNPQSQQVEEVVTGAALGVIGAGFLAVGAIVFKILAAASSKDEKKEKK